MRKATQEEGNISFVSAFIPCPSRVYTLWEIERRMFSWTLCWWRLLWLSSRLSRQTKRRLLLSTESREPSIERTERARERERERDIHTQIQTDIRRDRKTREKIESTEQLSRTLQVLSAPSHDSLLSQREELPGFLVSYGEFILWERTSRSIERPGIVLEEREHRTCSTCRRFALQYSFPAMQGSDSRRLNGITVSHRSLLHHHHRRHDIQMNTPAASRRHS